MKPKKSAPGEMSAATSRPARTPEAQENYMINLAMKLVERRLLEGTASSAETTHFLKLATSKNELEKTKLEEENNSNTDRSENRAAGGGKQAAAGKDRDTTECKALRGDVREGHCCHEEIQRLGRG